MKFIVLIGDGIADLPLEAFNLKTPLELAKLEYINKIDLGIALCHLLAAAQLKEKNLFEIELLDINLPEINENIPAIKLKEAHEIFYKETKKDFRNEVQIIATVLSADGENNPDVLGIIGASVAIKLAGLPILKLVGAIRVGRVNGEFIVNPTTTELKNSDLEIVVAGTEDNIVMLEGEGNEISESDFLELLYFAHNEIKKMLKFLVPSLVARVPRRLPGLWRLLNRKG